jgi:hypothetical protein
LENTLVGDRILNEAYNGSFASRPGSLTIIGQLSNDCRKYSGGHDSALWQVASWGSFSWIMPEFLLQYSTFVVSCTVSMISCHSSGLFAANDFASSVAVGSCHSDLRHDLMSATSSRRQVGGSKEKESLHHTGPALT